MNINSIIILHPLPFLPPSRPPLENYCSVPDYCVVGGLSGAPCARLASVAGCGGLRFASLRRSLAPRNRRVAAVPCAPPAPPAQAGRKVRPCSPRIYGGLRFASRRRWVWCACVLLRYDLQFGTIFAANISVPLKCCPKHHEERTADNKRFGEMAE